MKQSNSKKCLLGIQHVLAMFGATCLVPMLTGLNASIALICAGLGTLIFHLITKRKVPVFLGSSFAFIAAIQYVLHTDQVASPNNSMIQLENLANLKGALIVAGLIYIVFGLIIKFVGYEKVTKILPPVVTGPMIIVIGLRLSSSAVNNALYNNGEFSLRCALVAFIVVLVIVCISVFTKGFISLMPILIALTIGYIISFPLGVADAKEWWNSITSASFLSFTDASIRDQLFVLPRFDLSAILAIAPISIVTIIEHVGDITTNGAVVGQNFIADPGVHRTLMGDGVATALAGCLGGPANTTYGENTGVLAVTKNYDPQILRIAACFALLLGIFGKIGAVIQNVPLPVSGGISIVLFGMIASVGVRILITNRVDFSNSRNLMVASLIFVLGIGIDNISITKTVTISGLAVAALVGILFALVLPEPKSADITE